MRMPLLNCLVLADDDPDHAFLFKRILQQVAPEKELICVHDGQELLELLQTVQPEYLFLDLNMPCKNGMECLKAIRQNPDLKEVRIIIYSSSIKMKDIANCYAQKADYYIVKPYNTEHLTNALRTILQKDSEQTIPMSYHYFINNKFVPFTAR